MLSGFILKQNKICTLLCVASTPNTLVRALKKARLIKHCVVYLSFKGNKC